MKYIREYTEEQVLEDIKAIGEGREEDVKLPLRVLRKEHPKAYKKAYNKAYYEKKMRKRKC